MPIKDKSLKKSYCDSEGNRKTFYFKTDMGLSIFKKIAKSEGKTISEKLAELDQFSKKEGKNLKDIVEELINNELCGSKETSKSEGEKSEVEKIENKYTIVNVDNKGYTITTKEDLLKRLREEPYVRVPTKIKYLQCHSCYDGPFNPHGPSCSKEKYSDYYLEDKDCPYYKPIYPCYYCPHFVDIDRENLIITCRYNPSKKFKDKFKWSFPKPNKNGLRNIELIIKTDNRLILNQLVFYCYGLLKELDELKIEFKKKEYKEVEKTKALPYISDSTYILGPKKSDIENFIAHLRCGRGQDLNKCLDKLMNPLMPRHLLKSEERDKCPCRAFKILIREKYAPLLNMIHARNEQLVKDILNHNSEKVENRKCYYCDKEGVVKFCDKWLCHNHNIIYMQYL